MPDWNRLGNTIAWTLAVLLSLHTVLVLATKGSVTDDFTTVYSALQRFIHGELVYNEVYYYVDPHYLYSPGATLILSPLGYIPQLETARFVFICVNFFAIVAALGILIRMFGFKLSHAIWPISIALALLTETVRNTLIFSNINGILLLMFVSFIWSLIEEKQWISGTLIGFAILIKPMFLPILFLPFLKKQWKTTIIGLSIPLILNIIAWFVMPGAGAYVRRTMPYISEVRDFANSSMPGIAIYFETPRWLELSLFIFFGALVAASAFLLAHLRETEPLLWATTTSGVLLTGVFFLSSLGQMYYSMMLFPMIFTLFTRRSVFHSAVAWVAAFLFLAPIEFSSYDYPDLARWAGYTMPTFGWGLFIIVIFVASVIWFFEDRATKNRAEAAPAAEQFAIFNSQETN